MHARVARWAAALAAAALTLPLLAACGGEDEPSLVVYNAQHEELIDAVAKAFTEKTGIEVQLRNGSDLELGNQLATEGTASPADVFLTENSPAMTLVDSKDLFAELDQATLDQIPEQYRPDDGQWTGFAGRSTVLVYNKRHGQPRPAAGRRSSTWPSRSGRARSPSPRRVPTSRRSSAPCSPPG